MTQGVVVHCARATRVQYASPLISGNFDITMTIGTMIEFCERKSIANFSRCIVHVRTYKLERHLCRETKSNAKIAKMVYLRFWPKAMLSNAGL